MCLPIAVRRPELVYEEFFHLGFECVVIRNPRGFFCGYIRVPLGHPWHGLDLPDEIDVHGQVSYSRADLNCEKEGDDNA